MKKAVLFDMDGVLITSFKTCFKAYNYVLKHYDLKELSKETYIKNHWGQSIYENIKIELGNDPEKCRQAVNYYDENYMKFIKHSKLVPGVKKTLAELKRKGFKTGVVTSTGRKLTEQILEYFSLRKYFDVIVCGDEVNKPKPAPESVFKACKLLKVKAHETVYVGDAENDIKAGKAAGCLTVSVTKNLKGADKEISQLSELI